MIASSAVRSRWRPSSRRARPASLSVARLPLRSNRLPPRSFSSLATACDRADGTRCTALAAELKAYYGNQAIRSIHKGFAMIIRRPSEQRGHAKHGWLRAKHSFSFADYYDPAEMGWGSLRVINEDRVAPGTGFGRHGHREM